MIRLILLTAAVAIYTSLCSADSGGGRFIDRFDWLARYGFEQDLRVFAGHRSNGAREAYLMAANTEFGAFIASFDGVWHLGLTYENHLGMGRQSKAILFDPRDAHYAIVPYLLFERGSVNYEAGLDHRCFHQIDRRDVNVSPYWNRVYAKAASGLEKIPLSWELGAGYFVRKLGGMDRTLLSGGHPWGYSAEADVRYAHYHSGLLTLRARGGVTMLGDTAGSVYFAGKLGIDADLGAGGGRRTFGVFADYNYEFPKKLPLYSKNGLFELGIRFKYQ